jgi:hypothetical protein
VLLAWSARPWNVQKYKRKYTETTWRKAWLLGMRSASSIRQVLCPSILHCNLIDDQNSRQPSPPVII